MSEAKNLVIQQSDLTQISSELNLLEQMIAYGSLDEIWEKTDHLRSLFETLPHGDENIEMVRQQFKEMVRPTEEMKREMKKMEEEIDEMDRKFDAEWQVIKAEWQAEAERREEEEEADRKFEAEWQAIEEAWRREEEAERIEKTVYEAEDIILAEQERLDKNKWAFTKFLYEHINEAIIECFQKQINEFEKMIEYIRGKGWAGKASGLIFEIYQEMKDLKQQIQEFRQEIDDINKELDD